MIASLQNFDDMKNLISVYLTARSESPTLTLDTEVFSDQILEELVNFIFKHVDKPGVDA